MNKLAFAYFSHLLCNKWSKQEDILNIRQPLEGPKENHKGDQRTGAPAL